MAVALTGRAGAIYQGVGGWGETPFEATAGPLPLAAVTGQDDESLSDALRLQGDGDARDRGLIVERLGWTPKERLDANAAFLRFYLSVRPEGSLLPE